MVKQLSKEEITTIKIMREEGYSARVIGQKLGRPDKTIKNWFKKLGLPTNLKDSDIERKTRVYSIVCKACGESYNSERYNVKFCSQLCRNAFNRKNRGDDYTCRNCGKAFKSYKKSLHCSYDCRIKTREKENIEKLAKRTNSLNKWECLTCNSIILSNRKKLYCDNACRHKHNYVSAVRTHNIKCQECGKHKEVSSRRKKYCSDECVKKFSNRQKETKRRKAIRKNGKVDWDISIERLIKRDGIKCYLCGDDVIKHNNTNHELYPSIEHVMPVAKGGTHTWDNVRLAHRKCNWEKSDKIITQRHTPGQKKALS